MTVPPSVVPRVPNAVTDASVTATACLNCGAPLTAEYCGACGQRAVDLGESTWHTIREAFSDASDIDGRVLRTVRALKTPGQLTVEFVHGRRAPFVGPLKIFLFAGAALTTTWILTRGIDYHYYGFTAAKSASIKYIDTVVRASSTGCMAVALSSWVLGLGRRRLLDEVVFALHCIAAMLLLTSAAIWLGTGWKVLWGTAAVVPAAVPPLPFLVYLPALVFGLAYVAIADRRVHGGAWWIAVVRALVFTALAAVVTQVFITRMAR
jgi:hypothetical protein